MNNQIWFNTWLSVWWLTGSTVMDTINNINSYKEETSKKYDSKKTLDLEHSAKNMFECSVKTTDWKTKNINISWANSAFMELIIKQAAQNAGSKAYDNLWEWEILCHYLNNNPSQINNTNMVLKNQMSVQVWAKKNWLDIPQKEYSHSEPIYIKWQSGISPFVKGLWWTTLWAELWWWTLSWIWNYLENKTWDKTTPEDASRYIRYVKYENAPNKLVTELSNVDSQIREIEENLSTAWESVDKDSMEKQLKELNAKKSSIEETIEQMNKTKTNLPQWKPETVRETAKSMWLGWWDLDAAWKAATESSVYYATEIKPYLKMSDKRFDVSKILKEITREDLNVSAWMWEDMQALLNKEIAANAWATNVSLEELDKIWNQFRLSSKRLAWENSNSLQQQLYDEIHTKINNLVNKIVEEENPWAWFTNKNQKYSNMLKAEEQAKDYAVKWGKRTLWQWVSEDIKKITTKNPKVLRWWKWLNVAWEAIRPSTYIIKLIKKLGNKTSKIKDTAKTVLDNGADKLKNGVNPKSFKQPKLLWWDPVWTLQLLEWLWELWDSILWWETTVWDVANIIWQIPWIEAANAVDDVLQTSYEWSLLRDEDKPLYMKEILEEIYPWETFSLEEAEKMYKTLKENWSIYLQPHMKA